MASRKWLSYRYTQRGSRRMNREDYLTDSILTETSVVSHLTWSSVERFLVFSKLMLMDSCGAGSLANFISVRPRSLPSG